MGMLLSDPVNTAGIISRWMSNLAEVDAGLPNQVMGACQINRSRVILRQILSRKTTRCCSAVTWEQTQLGARSAGYRAAAALRVTPEACCKQ